MDRAIRSSDRDFDEVQDEDVPVHGTTLSHAQGKRIPAMMHAAEQGADHSTLALAHGAQPAKKPNAMDAATPKPAIPMRADGVAPQDEQ